MIIIEVMGTSYLCVENFVVYIYKYLGVMTRFNIDYNLPLLLLCIEK
jgi:hypothetical protein